MRTFPSADNEYYLFNRRSLSRDPIRTVGQVVEMMKKGGEAFAVQMTDIIKLAKSLRSAYGRREGNNIKEGSHHGY